MPDPGVEMVHYELLAFEDKELIGLAVEGHATEYGGRSGENIVCAAVSAVSDMAVRGCGHYDSKLECGADQGLIYFTCKKSAETMAILKAAMLGLDEIRSQYPMCLSGNGYKDGSKND